MLEAEGQPRLWSRDAVIMPASSLDGAPGRAVRRTCPAPLALGPLRTALEGSGTLEVLKAQGRERVGPGGL